MQHGDLSNRVSPKVLLVYEGALGFCTDRPRFDRLARRGRWGKAMKCWTLSDLCARQVLWLYHKRDLTIEIVTFLGPGFAAELEDELSDLPLHRVWDTTPDDLSRKIAYMPDLAAVYDPEPQRWLTYGGKGRYLTSVHQIGDGM